MTNEERFWGWLSAVLQRALDRVEERRDTLFWRHHHPGADAVWAAWEQELQYSMQESLRLPPAAVFAAGTWEMSQGDRTPGPREPGGKRLTDRCP